MSDFEAAFYVFYGSILFTFGFASMVVMLMQALTA